MDFLKVMFKVRKKKNQKNKKKQEMIEPLFGRDDVMLICHRKKADLINSYFVLFSTFLLEQTVIGNFHFS